MAKIPLKFDEIIDGRLLREELSALTAETNGDGSGQPVRTAVLKLLKTRPRWRKAAKPLNAC